MGLDVCLVKGTESVSWQDQSVMHNFPFSVISEEYPVEEEIDGETYVVGPRTHQYVSEIIGMSLFPNCGISFRGRGYSNVLAEFGLPTLYDDYNPDATKQLYCDLSAKLNAYSLEPEDKEVHGEPLRNIRALAALLGWAAFHEMSLVASY